MISLFPASFDSEQQDSSEQLDSSELLQSRRIEAQDPPQDISQTSEGKIARLQAKIDILQDKLQGVMGKFVEANGVDPESIAVRGITLPPHSLNVHQLCDKGFSIEAVMVFSGCKNLYLQSHWIADVKHEC